MSVKVLYPEPKKVTIGGKEYEIKALPLKKLTKIVKILATLNLEDREEVDTWTDAIITAISIALDIPKAWLEENLMSVEALIAMKEIMSINQLPLMVQMQDLKGSATKQ